MQEAQRRDRIIYGTSHRYRHEERCLTLAEWSEFLELPTQLFKKRIKQHGFTEAVAMPSPKWKAPKKLRIDPCDRDKIKDHKWSVKDGGIYRHQITGNGESRTMTIFYLHREILGLTGNQSIMVRFKNGNKYDCRRENLVQLEMNEHVRENINPVGCTYRKGRGRWESYITHKNKRYFLLSSEDKEVAIAAYQEAVERIKKGLPPKAE